MRRTRLLLLLALLAGFALVAAACGGSSGGSGDDGGGDDGGEDAAADLPECPVDALDSADGPVEVTLWHAYVAKTEETLNVLADQYNESQDKVHVNVESQGTSYRELQRKYQQAIPSNGLPGIAILEDIQNQSMADSGTVLPFTSCIEAEDYDTSDFLPIAL